MSTPLYFDLDLGYFVERIRDTTRRERVIFQFQQSEEISIMFLRDSKPVEILGNDVKVGFVIKPNVEYDADPLAAADLAWDAERELYSGNLVLNTTGINAALPSNVTCAEFLGGAGWQYDEEHQIYPTNTLKVTILNTVYTGTMPEPIPSPTADAWLSERAVRFDIAQDLTDAQAEQARDNLKIVDPEAPSFAEITGDPYDNSELEDAFNQKANHSVTITGEKSITGGGDLSQNRTIELVGDVANPNPDEFYGTDSNGNRCWRSAPSVSVSWGDIDGDIADQTDLQDALNGKQDQSSNLDLLGDTSMIEVTSISGFTIIKPTAGKVINLTAQIVGDSIYAGFPIADDFIGSAATWNAKQNALTEGTGVSLADGVVSIGQSVAITAGVTFGSVTTSGNVTAGGRLRCAVADGFSSVIEQASGTNFFRHTFDSASITNVTTSRLATAKWSILPTNGQKLIAGDVNHTSTLGFKSATAGVTTSDSGVAIAHEFAGYNSGTPANGLGVRNIYTARSNGGGATPVLAGADEVVWTDVVDATRTSVRRYYAVIDGVETLMAEFGKGKIWFNPAHVPDSDPSVAGQIYTDGSTALHMGR